MSAKKTPVAQDELSPSFSQKYPTIDIFRHCLPCTAFFALIPALSFPVLHNRLMSICFQTFLYPDIPDKKLSDTKNTFPNDYMYYHDSTTPHPDTELPLYIPHV